MIGIIFNIDDVKDLVKLLAIETGKNNMLFIVVDETLFRELEKSSDKKTFTSSLKFREGVKYNLCSIYDSKTGIIKMEKCDARYLKLFNASVKKFFKDTVKIMAHYKEDIIEEGFSNPSICGKDGEVCLIRDPKSPKQKKDTVKLDYAFIVSHRAKKFCEIVLKIKQESIEYLQHINRTSKSAEIFGKFDISSVNQDGAEIVYTLSIDKDSLTKGKDDEIDATPSLYNFHSHPEDAYKKYKVNYGPPSTQDYKSIYILATEYNTIVHFVSSIEGLYIIYLNPDNKASSTQRENIIEKMRFEDADSVLELQKYIEEINSYGLFNVRLISWKSNELTRGIRISFSKSGNYGNCKIRD
jgi:hypothetical protein